MHSKSARFLRFLVLFAVAALAWLPRAEAQQPPVAAELFFSEYVEGSSNNKALEIYNGTGAPIDLEANGYTVQMFFNGSASAGLTIKLTGTVASGDVFVLAHSAATAQILAAADQTNGSGWFNGDDVVVLRKGADFVDVIGQIVFPDPGTEWGSGLTSTADNTLRRKCAVTAGDPVGSDAFDPAIEWDGFATNAFDDLGLHCTHVEPEPTLRAIHEIQGDGAATPRPGELVRTEGNIVTAVTTNGFFMQTPAANVDDNPESSQGIFVFTGSRPGVLPGDDVTVVGTASEFFNQTEISSTSYEVTSSGNPLPSPIPFDETDPSPFAATPTAALEQYEGMLVRLEDGVATGPTNQFGETPVVARATRAFRAPGILAPGLPGLPVWDGDPEVIELDFGTIGTDVNILGGTVIELAEGPLAFAFGDYQILPTSFVKGAEPALPRAVRAKAAGEVTIASQNLLRLFDTVNDPDVDDEVEQPEAYAARLAKISQYVRGVLGSPDVLAVQEAENLGVLQDLALQIAADDVSVHYTAHLVEGNDIGGIDVGFLVRDTVRIDSVEPFGREDIFELDGSLLNDRPPLVLRGAYLAGGAPFPFVIINVHQRSLSGIDGSGAGAARVRAKRHEQALRLSRYIQSIQTADPDVRLIVLGDFNAFEFTDGYVDVMGQVTGLLDPAGALVPGTDEVNPDLTNLTFSLPAEERYSFVFEGVAQSLDHVLTSQALGPFLRGVEHARGNADGFVAAATDATTTLRTADHDGTVLFLMTIPLDKDECKDGGWRRFKGAFPNQGQCVSFVEAKR